MTHIQNFTCLEACTYDMLTCLESANEYVTMQGFDPITDHVLNPNNRYLSYNERGQMCMARTYRYPTPAKYQVDNLVIEITISE